MLFFHWCSLPKICSSTRLCTYILIFFTSLCYLNFIFHYSLYLNKIFLLIVLLTLYFPISLCSYVLFSTSLCTEISFSSDLNFMRINNVGFYSMLLTILIWNLFLHKSTHWCCVIFIFEHLMKGHILFPMYKLYPW